MDQILHKIKATRPLVHLCYQLCDYDVPIFFLPLEARQLWQMNSKKWKEITTTAAMHLSSTWDAEQANSKDYDSCRKNCESEKDTSGFGSGGRRCQCVSYTDGTEIIGHPFVFRHPRQYLRDQSMQWIRNMKGVDANEEVKSHHTMD